MLASLAVMLFVLVTNINNTTQELQKNKIFETFDGEKKQDYANLSFTIVKVYGGAMFANTTQTERELRMIKLFLLVEPSQFGQN